jgi:hypothetical protein
VHLKCERGNYNAGKGQHGQEIAHGEKAFQIDDISASRDRMDA